MKKRFFWIGIFVLLISPATLLAQYKVDLLVFHQLHYTDWPLRINFFPTDTSEREDFDIGPFLTLHVPPCSHKSDAICIEMHISAHITETNNPAELLSTLGYCRMVLTSPAILANIENSQSAGIFQIESNQDGLRPVLPNKTIRREVKFIIPKNGPTWWGMWYKDTGQSLDEQEELKIFNRLFDEGFDISFSFAGQVQGVQSYQFGIFAVYISSIEGK